MRATCVLTVVSPAEEQRRPEHPEQDPDRDHPPGGHPVDVTRYRPHGVVIEGENRLQGVQRAGAGVAKHDAERAEGSAARADAAGPGG